MSKNILEYIEDNTLRIDASRRGGGIEIDASDYLDIEGAKITAYQNYLGGGMLGSIQSDHNFIIPEDKREQVEELAEGLRRYFYNITNGYAADWDEWSAGSYEEIQNRSESAY